MSDDLRKSVRDADRDRYLSALFAPGGKQKHLVALYAFDAEIARIPRLVSEPQIGEIRLQWWHDTLDAIAQGQTPDHPVALAFADTMRNFALPVEHLANLIEARRNDLYANRYPSLFALEAYVAETEATIMQFAAIILDRPSAAQSATLIGSAGTAYGLARLMAHPTRSARYIPTGETRESVQRLAMKRLAEARGEMVPNILWPAVLPAALTVLYLQGEPSPLRRQWRLWRASRIKAL